MNNPKAKANDKINLSNELLSAHVDVGMWRVPLLYWVELLGALSTTEACLMKLCPQRVAQTEVMSDML